MLFLIKERGPNLSVRGNVFNKSYYIPSLCQAQQCALRKTTHTHRCSQFYGEEELREMRRDVVRTALEKDSHCPGR
jgi:hypothetical protein